FDVIGPGSLALEAAFHLQPAAISAVCRIGFDGIDVDGVVPDAVVFKIPATFGHGARNDARQVDKLRGLVLTGAAGAEIDLRQVINAQGGKVGPAAAMVGDYSQLDRVDGPG